MFETLFRYGSRDFRDIGHKAIFVANSYRTLQCVGWRYAEPVLRSLAYALLNHRGDPNPAQSDLPADQPGRRNAELAQKLRGDWQQGKLDDGATREMLLTLREGSADDACDKAVQLINGGAHPQSVWDAVFLGGGELLFRQRGIVSLHALTSANALHYAYETSQSDAMRRMALLQNAAFVTLFRDALASRGKVRDFAIEKLEPAALQGQPKQRLEEIFAEVSKDRTEAARMTLAALDSDVNATELIDAARVLVFLKGTGSHDYKFSSAVLEDYFHVSPAWRDRFLAAGVYNLHGSGERDNALVKRARAALDA